MFFFLGFWTGGSAAMLDLQSVKSYMTPLGMTIGQCNLSVAATASVGGFTYGLLGSKTYSNDILVSAYNTSTGITTTSRTI